MLKLLYELAGRIQDIYNLEYKMIKPTNDGAKVYLPAAKTKEGTGFITSDTLQLLYQYK